MYLAGWPLGDEDLDLDTLCFTLGDDINSNSFRFQSSINLKTVRRRWSQVRLAGIWSLDM